MRRWRDAKRLLSARNLDDVPVNVRIGSPSDLPDSVVYQFASKGILPPCDQLRRRLPCCLCTRA